MIDKLKVPKSPRASFELLWTFGKPRVKCMFYVFYGSLYIKCIIYRLKDSLCNNIVWMDG